MNRLSSLDEAGSDLPPEILVGALLTSRTPAEFLGIPRATLYRIANVGYRLFCAGRLEQARQIYEGLVAADPRDSVFHCHLGAVYHRLGRLTEASASYSRALVANPRNVEALAGRGEIALQQQQGATARADLIAAIRFDPQGEKAASVRARLLLLSLQKAMAKPDAALPF